MNWEDTYYVFGTLYFAFSFVLMIVLIIGAVLILRNLNKLQITVQEAMEEKKSLATVLPMMIMASLEARSWWKKYR
jgi:uncharacterized metal-binding protein